MCIVAYTHQLCDFDTPIRHKAEPIAAGVQATYLSRLSSKSEVRFASYCSEGVLTRTLPFLGVLTQPSNSACQDRSSPDYVLNAELFSEKKSSFKLKFFQNFCICIFLLTFGQTKICTMEYLRAILGITIFVGVAWLLSKNRKAIDKKLVLTGIVLQLIIGVLVLKVSWFADIFKSIGVGFTIFISYTREGTQFLFGKLGLITEPIGFVFAFQVLPIIVFFSAVTAGLYYLGILQKVVYAIAWVMSKTMRLSGAESLSAAGNIFLGQTEAPLLVKPFVANMTKSELNCLMTGGMATLAGSVMASYISMLGGGNPEVEAQFASYFLTASIMNAPAALVMSKILYPETEEIDTRLQVSKESLGVNIIDAIATGAADGLKLALNVGGMLIAFIAIVALLNGFLGWIGKITDLNFWVATSTNGVFKELSLQYLFGLLGQPVAWLMGTDWDKSLVVGSLIGQKTAINEYIAYDQLAKFKQIEGLLDTKAIVIATFALCGFANFSSIAIQIGGIGGMAPNRQSDISRLGLRALLGGSLATFMSATIAGALIG